MSGTENAENNNQLKELQITESLETLRKEFQAKIEKMEQLITKVEIQDARFKHLDADLSLTKNDVGQVRKHLEISTSQLEEYIDSLLVGSVSAFAMKKPPKEWLECDGREVSRSDYARLFERIGSTFGDGDGQTTFNLPDLRGVFVRGWDADGKYDTDRSFGSYQADQIQDHTHNDSGHTHDGNTSAAGEHDHSGISHSQSDENPDLSVIPNDPQAENLLELMRKLRSGLNQRVEQGMSPAYKGGKTSEDGNHLHSGKTSKDGSHNHELTIYAGKFLLADHTRLFDGDVDIEKETDNKYYTEAGGSHSHTLSIDPAGSHSHDIFMNPDGSHSHKISSDASYAKLGSPISSFDEPIRYGNETRSKNVSLMFCIKF